VVTSIWFEGGSCFIHIICILVHRMVYIAIYLLIRMMFVSFITSMTDAISIA